MVDRYAGIRSPTVREAVKRYESIKKKQVESQKRKRRRGGSREPEVQEPKEVQVEEKEVSQAEVSEVSEPTKTVDISTGTRSPEVREAIVRRITERGEVIERGAGRVQQIYGQHIQ